MIFMLKHYTKASIGEYKGKPAWCVVSHKTGRVLSCYGNKREGLKALRRIEMFLHIKKKKNGKGRK
jgi:hypothetical protein